MLDQTKQQQPNKVKMKHLKNYVCATVLVAATSGLATTRSVPSRYSTIQAAVNAAASGDTIMSLCRFWGKVHRCSQGRLGIEWKTVFGKPNYGRLIEPDGNGSVIWKKNDSSRRIPNYKRTI